MDSRIAELITLSQSEEKAGNISGTLHCAQQAFELAQENADSQGECAALAQLAYIHMHLGHYEQAEEFATKALDTASDTICCAHALSVLGICASHTNQLDRAEALLHRAVDLYRQLGDDAGRAMGLHNLAAVVYSLRGQFELALSASIESSQINQKIGVSDWGSPMIRAEIYRMIGDREHSRVSLEELLRVSKPGSLQRGTHDCYQARLALDEDNLDGAETWLAASRSIAEAVGNPVLDVWLRVEYSRLSRLRGDIPTALTWAEDAVSHAERAGFTYLFVLARVEQVQAVWNGGDPATAQEMLETVLPLAAECDLRYEVARISFFLAALAQQQGLFNASDKWVEAVERIRQGGWIFLLQRERTLAFPLIAHHLKGNHPKACAAASGLMEPLSRIVPLPLHISGLGRFRVYQGRRPIPDRHWQRRKAGELFRFLLLQPGYSIHRDVLIEALWPEHTTKSGQAVFHQATSAVRRILEPDLPGKFPSRYLDVEGERITLKLPSGSNLDFEKFENDAENALAEPNRETLEKVRNLYSDDLFPADRFADWAATRRERLAQLYLRLLTALATCSLESGRPHQCLECTSQILARDEWNEDAVLLAMQARLALRDRPGAVALYDRLAETLHQDLGLSPRSDMQALAESLRAG